PVLASRARPAGSWRWAVAEAGIASPVTCEKFTPPRSKKSPSSMMRVRPPPPPGRSQPSARKGRPSKASSRATMSCCSPVRYCLTAAVSMSALACERAVADVAAVLRAVEADRVGDGVGLGLRVAHAVAECGHAQHAAAGRDDILALHGGAGVEDVGVLTRRRRQAGDDVTL